MNFSKKLNLRDVFVFPFKLTPAQAGLALAYRAGNASKQAVNVLLTAYFINTAIAILQRTQPYNNIMAPLAGLLAYLGWDYIIGPLMQFVYKNQEIRMRLALRPFFVEKRVKLEYKHIENPKVWDLISRTWDTPELKLKEFPDNVLSLAETIFSTASVLVILMTAVWWAGAIIIVVSAPLFYLAMKTGKKTYDARRETSKAERGYNFLSEIMTSREAALERGLFGFTKKLNERYLKEYEKARIYKRNVSLKWFIRSKTVGLAASAISALSLFILLGPALHGTISIGLFISLTAALFSSVNGLSWGLPYIIEQISKSKEYVKDVNEFFALSEQPGSESLPAAVPPPFESVEFKNVTFTYPNTDKKILDGLSLKIESGRHYSFVGVNGAGKTTVTKLMTRLYDDYGGEILLNGRNLKDYGMAEIKAAFSSVFQDFARYQISVRDNIELGAVNGVKEGETDRAVELIGLTDAVGKLSNRIETKLGKIDDEGVDLSGGEWQRVAMARAILSPAPVKILDEPTAALDPIAESALYEKFEQISRGFTTIFISHRLGSTKLADTIFVIDGGKVTETGSHAELMELGGVYAEMFESQRSWYK